MTCGRGLTPPVRGLAGASRRKFGRGSSSRLLATLLQMWPRAISLRMPAEIARETGTNWYQHAGAHEVLTHAILSRLEALKPKGSKIFGNRPHATTSDDDPSKLGELIEFRLRRQPDFTTSPTRKWMEEEYQRSHVEMMGSPRALLDSQQQPRKPDQPKKRGK